MESGTSHESDLKWLCYMPFDIDTITVAAHEGGVFDLMPPVQGVAEEIQDQIQIVVSADGSPFTLRHAVLVDGPFQLPEGYRLASDVVYLYSDPSQPVRPFILHLPHWCHKEQGLGEEGEGVSQQEPEGDRHGEDERGLGEGDDLVFVKARHTLSWENGERLYKFELQEGGNFHLSSTGSLQVSSHSTLFGIAFKERSTSILKYCATHLEREDTFGQRVDVALTFATATWQQVCSSVCLYMCQVIHFA